MSSWSRQRRFAYGAVVLAIVLVATAGVSWKLLYKPPSCFDGKKNGSEEGVDCGGACQKLCASDFLAPIASWTKFEQVAPEVYNFATYVINPNPDVGATNVPYHVEIFDKEGVLITKYDSTVSLPPHRNTLAFKGSLNIGSRIPYQATFSLTGVPNWQKEDDVFRSLDVVDKNYTEDPNGSGSSLQVTLKNHGTHDVGPLSVYTVLYDRNGLVLGFSKTKVDGIAAGDTALAPFTWPFSHNGAVISIEVLPVAE